MSWGCKEALSKRSEQVEVGASQIQLLTDYTLASVTRGCISLSGVARARQSVLIEALAYGSICNEVGPGGNPEDRLKLMLMKVRRDYLNSCFESIA